MTINFSLKSLLAPTPAKAYALCHGLVGALFPMFAQLVGLRFGWSYGWIVGTGIILAWIPYKEFYLDLKDEAKEVSGGIWGGIEDSLEYLAGVLLALLVIVK